MADGDIADWLTEQGLEVHASLFADNRIDFDVLTDLSEADLRELGLPLGDRKRLMKAIEALADISAARQNWTRQSKWVMQRS